MRDLIGLRARLLLPLPACEEVDENTEKHGFVFTIVSRFQMQAPSPGHRQIRKLHAPWSHRLTIPSFSCAWDHFVFRSQSNQSQLNHNVRYAPHLRSPTVSDCGLQGLLARTLLKTISTNARVHVPCPFPFPFPRNAARAYCYQSEYRTMITVESRGGGR